MFQSESSVCRCSCWDVRFELYVNRKEADFFFAQFSVLSARYSLGRSCDFSFCRSFIFTSTVEVHNKAFICIWRSSMYKVYCAVLHWHFVLLIHYKVCGKSRFSLLGFAWNFQYFYSEFHTKTSLTVSKAKFNLVEFKGFDTRSTKGFSDFQCFPICFCLPKSLGVELQPFHKVLR